MGVRQVMSKVRPEKFNVFLLQNDFSALASLR